MDIGGNPVNALLPDILEIEDLDFTLDIPCEHSQHPEGIYGHQGPAYYYIKSVPPCGCPPLKDYFFICKGGYDFPIPVYCRDCGAMFSAAEIWHILYKVGA